MINLFIAISILMWCIWFHEIGHLLYFKFVLKRNVGLVFTFKRGFEILFNENKRDTINIYLSGILLGAFPLCIGFDTLPFMWNVVLVSMYVAGSWYDIKQMLRMMI